jgi:hypothetical protein
MTQVGEAEGVSRRTQKAAHQNDTLSQSYNDQLRSYKSWRPNRRMLLLVKYLKFRMFHKSCVVLFGSETRGFWYWCAAFYVHREGV